MRFFHLLAASSFLAGPALASDCPSLFSDPAVKQVIDEHIERVRENRRTGLRTGYNKAANVELLKGRIGEADREIVTADLDATVTFENLTACFPSYLAMYMDVAGEGAGSAKGDVVAPQTTAADTASRQSDCPRLLLHPRAVRAVRDSTPKDGSSTWRDLDAQVLDLRLSIRGALRPFVSGLASANGRSQSEANAQLEAVLSGLSAEQARICYPEFIAAAEKAHTLYAAEAAERKRKDEQRFGGLIQTQKEEEERQRRYAEEEATPEGALKHAYSSYMFVQKCHASREGYAVVYVSDNELEQARTDIKKIETALLTQNPAMNSAAIWDAAAKDVSEGSLSFARSVIDVTPGWAQQIDQACKGFLLALKGRLTKLKPEARLPAKDF